MTLRSSLHEWLRDTLNVPVYEARLPIRPQMPALVQRFVSGRSILTQSNPRSLLERRIQFDIYANNDAEVDNLSLALLRALDGYHGPMEDVDIGWAGLLSEVDTIPQEVKHGGLAETRYRRIMDFTLAYQEPRNAV